MFTSVKAVSKITLKTQDKILSYIFKIQDTIFKLVSRKKNDPVNFVTSAHTRLTALFPGLPR